MRTSFIRVLISILSVLFLMPEMSIAQYEQTPAQTPAANPPIAQPLIREGDLAVSLAEALGLGTQDDEVEAESALNSAGVAPRNGWIADYPVTPDVAGEVRASIAEAADSGRLSIGKDAALTAFQDILTGYGLAVRAAESQGGTVYQPESTDISNYYNTEGPPVVTYYAPPPDYAYMYTWVPYPFWWWDFWHPGFFVLVDFDVRVRPRERVHLRDHDRVRPREHERRHEDFISNHFRGHGTERMRRIDPTNRFRGGTSGEIGGTRGFSAPRPFGGTRSGAFDRFGSPRSEGAAGDRGFRSRSGAGIIPRRDIPNRDLPNRDRINRERIDRGKTDRGDRRDRGDRGETRRDRDNEGFRDSRGGTFHGGGRRR